MTEIVQKLDYESNLDLLPEEFKRSPNLKGMLETSLLQGNKLEQAMFEIRDEFWLNTGFEREVEVVTYRAILNGDGWFEIPEIEIPESVPFEIEYMLRSYGGAVHKAIFGDGTTGDLQFFNIVGVVYTQDLNEPSIMYQKSDGTSNGWGDAPIDGRSAINEKLKVKLTRDETGKMELYYDGVFSNDDLGHEDDTFIINQLGWGTTNGNDRFVGELYDFRVSVDGVDVFNGAISKSGLKDSISRATISASGGGTVYEEVTTRYRASLDGTNTMLGLSSFYNCDDLEEGYVEIDCELTDQDQYALNYPVRGSGAELSKLGLFLDYLSTSGIFYTSAGSNYDITEQFQSDVRDKRIVLKYKIESVIGFPPTPKITLYLNNVEVGSMEYSGGIRLDTLMSYLPGYFYSCHMVNSTTGQEINIETTRTGFKDTISGTVYHAQSGTTIEEVETGTVIVTETTNGAIGKQLDTLGEVFITDRLGEEDEDYRQRIIKQAAAQFSGTPEDIIQSLKSLYGATVVEYDPGYPGNPGTYNILTDIDVDDSVLENLSPAGVGGQFGNNYVLGDGDNYALDEEDNYTLG